MQLTKNKLTISQIQKLPQKINRFLEESKLNYNSVKFVNSTLQNIIFGLKGNAKHDLWICGENIDLYCLGKEEIDADGERIYTIYQLWIDPKFRDRLYRKLRSFLRFYIQKQGYKRFYIISSRLDKIKAYQRGIGKSFKPKFVIFSQEF